MLAVLPFDNESDEPEMSYFSDGVADEIIITLLRQSQDQGDRPHLGVPVSRRSQERGGGGAEGDARARWLGALQRHRDCASARN